MVKSTERHGETPHKHDRLLLGYTDACISKDAFMKAPDVSGINKDFAVVESTD